MNGESLNSKLPWEEVKQNELFKQMYSDSTLSTIVKSALENPENTGVDIKKDMIIFLQKDSAGGYLAVQGTVKDADKFKTFYGNVFKTAVTEKDGTSTYKNEKIIASWTKEKYVLVVDVPQMNEMNKMSMPSFDTTAPAPITYNRDLNAITASIFNLKEDNSLAKDEKFSELVNKKADVYFWVNAGEMSKGLADMPAMAMMNLGKLYEGSIFTAAATFDDGRITADLKSYSGKELSDLWKKYSGSKMSKDMVQRVPSKDVAVLFALSFKPEGLHEFIKLLGIEGFANMGAAFLGFTVDDFIKGNKGDIVFTVSDIVTDTADKVSANILFSASINDKVAFTKLIDAGKKMMENKADSATPSIFYNSNDKYFAIGNKQATVDTYIKTESNTKFDFFDKISEGPGGLYINFQYLLRALPVSDTDSAKKAIHTASVNMWDNLIASGGEFKNGGIVQHVEINLVDKKTNSLKQLNNYFGTIGTTVKNSKDAWIKTDSTTVVIDTITPAY
jgi:hypothetical protein